MKNLKEQLDISFNDLVAAIYNHEEHELIENHYRRITWALGDYIKNLHELILSKDNRF
jgi:predicted transcriptional regulator